MRGNSTGVKENVFVGAFGAQKIPNRKSHPSHVLLGSDMQVASPLQTAFQTAVGRASSPSHTRLYLCIAVNTGEYHPCCVGFAVRYSLMCTCPHL